MALFLASLEAHQLRTVERSFSGAIPDLYDDPDALETNAVLRNVPWRSRDDDMKARPSILIVHGHDLGRHMAPYGREAPSPCVEAFARTAATFQRAFAPSPQCSPSRAAMITGKVPNKSGMMGLAHLDWRLREPRDALPHKLRPLGYQTLLVGEQHEASDGELLGYERVEGTEWPQRARDVAPRFGQLLPQLDPDRPFFASVGFFEAHRPFDHPGYRDDDPEAVAVPAYLPDTPEVRAELAAFHGRVRAFDEGVGTVLEALDRHGLAQSTIVVVTTDHGIAFPRAKGTLFDAGLEIGLLVRWPGVTRPGSRIDGLTLNLDLFPTLLGAAGGSADPDVDGLDLRPLLQGRTGKVRDRFAAQLHWHDAYVPMRALRTETHKLILDFSARDDLYLPADVEDSPSGGAVRALGPVAPREVSLYDLERDPLEQQDLSSEPQQRERVVALRDELFAWMRSTSDPLLDHAEGAV